MVTGVNDFTTVAQVQAYLGLPASDPNSAMVLQPLITAASTFAETYISRTIRQVAYVNDLYDGPGTNRLMLRQEPVQSVQALAVYGQSLQPVPVPPSPNVQGFGYVIDAAKTLLQFIGGSFIKGLSNISVSYTAGYPDGVVTGENVNIPAAPQFTATLIQGSLLRLITSLTFAVGGAPLTLVGSNPIAGQYTLTGSTLGFAAADAGKALLCSYTTNGTPADIAQAVIEMVGYKWTKRLRLDKRSETLATQTVAYDMSEIPASARAVLDTYSRNFYV